MTRRRRRKRVAPRQCRRDPTAAVMTMIDLRDHMRGLTAERARIARQRSPLRRYLTRAVWLLIFVAFASVIILHAMT